MSQLLNIEEIKSEHKCGVKRGQKQKLGEPFRVMPHYSDMFKHFFPQLYVLRTSTSHDSSNITNSRHYLTLPCL